MVHQVHDRTRVGGVAAEEVGMSADLSQVLPGWRGTDPDGGTWDEEWRPIPRFPGYEASNLGRVRSIDHFSPSGRFVHGKVLKPHNQCSRGGQPYQRVSLVCADRSVGRATCLVHRLVISAFEGESELQVRHLDGDSRNNTIGNLAYGTGSENVADTIRMGRHPQAHNTHCPHGHPFDADNISVSRDADGNFLQRKCLTCRRESRRRYDERNPRVYKALTPEQRARKTELQRQRRANARRAS